MCRKLLLLRDLCASSAPALCLLTCVGTFFLAAPALASVPGPSPFAAPFYIVHEIDRPVVASYDGDGTPKLIGLRNDSLLVYRSVRIGELALLEAHALGSAP